MSRGNSILVLSCFFKVSKYISECRPRCRPRCGLLPTRFSSILVVLDRHLVPKITRCSRDHASRKIPTTHCPRDHAWCACSGKSPSRTVHVIMHGVHVPENPHQNHDFSPKMTSLRKSRLFQNYVLFNTRMT